MKHELAARTQCECMAAFSMQAGCHTSYPEDTLREGAFLQNTVALQVVACPVAEARVHQTGDHTVACLEPGCHRLALLGCRNCTRCTSRALRPSVSHSAVGASSNKQ